MTPTTVDYTLDVLITGYPGRPPFHGGLGWSTVALLSHGDRRVLIDVSSFGARGYLVSQLAERNLRTADITDILLTHAHWDHSVNWTLFPNATVAISQTELSWATSLTLPDGWLIPELYVRELAASPRLRYVRDGDEVLPGIVAHAVPGHTPGHMVYVAHLPEHDLVFSGDAAKNRAELLSRDADMTLDRDKSRRSIEKIWDLWRARPGNIIVPGHDVRMELRDGEPQYLADRHSTMLAWLGMSLNDLEEIDLAGHANQKTAAIERA
jgi:N-acyl homoserine lactone hydrolase